GHEKERGADQEPHGSDPITSRKRAQVRLACVCLVTICTGTACEGPPARAKSWRAAHEPRPAPAEADAPVASASTSSGGDDDRAPTLRTQIPVDPSSLDPFGTEGGPDRQMLEVTEDTVFETLLHHDSGSYQPGLAESFRVTAGAGGGAEIRLVLRAGVTFHDGKPFTAADAQFSIDAARRAASKNSRLKSALANVATVEIWGPRDLRVVLRRPSGYSLRALAEVPMLPAAVYGPESGR